MVEGELALKAGWPAMMRGYLHEEERYRKCFVGPWYLTGDLAKRDADGYFWFFGRADDVIKSSGHLIGPGDRVFTLLGRVPELYIAVLGAPMTMAWLRAPRGVERAGCPIACRRKRRRL
jgi:acetyl-CoA synthetase